MGMKEVLDVLKEDGGWMNSKEITDKLNVNYSSVRQSLVRLFKTGEIMKKRDTKTWHHNSYIYKAKE